MESPGITIVKRKKTTEPIKTVKIHINGIFHLLEIQTKRVFTYDPACTHFVWLGTLNEKDEIIYRDGWEIDMAKIGGFSV